MPHEPTFLGLSGEFGLKTRTHRYGKAQNWAQELDDWNRNAEKCLILLVELSGIEPPTS